MPSPEVIDEISTDAFLRQLNGGIQCWVMAGRILAKLYQKNSGVFAEIVERAPWVTVDVLWSFLRIGHGSLYPPLLLLKKCPAETYLHACPVETQQRALERPIDVVVDDKPAKPIIRALLVSELSKDACDVVFNKGRIRSRQEQLDYLAKRRRESVAAAAFATAPSPVVHRPRKPEPTWQPPSKGPMISLGTYLLSLERGQPKLVKLEGPPPINAQAITLTEGGLPGNLSATLELRRWPAFV